MFVVRRTGIALGGGGNDRFVIRGGTSRGGPGKDVFQVLAKGSGRAEGGRGADVLSFAKVRRGVTASLRTGTATWGDRSVTFAQIEVLFGSRRDDTLIGSARGDYLNGRGGDDILRGLGGNDLLIGDRGFDRGYGGPGGDVCATEVKIACEV